MILWALKNDCLVFAIPGGSVEKECIKKGLNFEPLRFGSLFKRSLQDIDIFYTVRSKDALYAFVAAFICGKRVIRMDFINRKIFWDRFIQVVPLDKLGWIEPYKGTVRKTKTWKICMVSRLKDDRKIREILQEVNDCKVNFTLYVIGGGDAGLLKGYSGKLVHIKSKLKKFRQLLSCMDLMIYTSAGTDKSCRAVLEAMDSAVVVVSREPLTKRYIDHHTGVVCEKVNAVLDKLTTKPAIVKKKAANAVKRVNKWCLG
ncbi:glycosyltransferase [Thermosulfidibacter takaii]|nr:glycosyltransferase [Thermosulfidibacter takaii]